MEEKRKKKKTVQRATGTKGGMALLGTRTASATTQKGGEEFDGSIKQREKRGGR